MKKYLLILFIIFYLPFILKAADIEKELESNWEMVLTSYRTNPNSKDTFDKIDNFILRWKDSNKYEASRAKYLKSMIFYNDKKYNQAYNEFKDLVDNFSWSSYTDSAMYKMGECLYNMGKYLDAIDTWNQFRFKYSNTMFDMEAVYGIALSYLNLKEYKKADSVLKSFLEKESFYKKDEKILLIGGLIDYYLERYEDAVAKLKEVKSDIAYYYLGQSYLKIPNKYTEAAGAFKRIAEQYSNSKYLESALYNKAETFYKGENYAVAVSDYEKFLNKFPNSNLAPYARFKRGSSLFMIKKYDVAINDFQKVITGSGDARVKAYAQYLIGECQRMLKKYDAALLAYKQLQNYPEIHEALSSSQVKAGWCYLVQGNFDKAETILTEFTGKFITHKDLPLGYYLLGTSSYNQKKYADAVVSYKFLLDKFGYTDLTEAALLMTELAYYNQEQYSLLISDASHMLEIMSSKFQSPNQNIRARAYYYLGMAYYRMGMFGPASKAFREIVDKFYDSDIVTEARTNLAWCFYELENYKGARTMAKDVVSNPNISKDVKMACEILIAHSYFCEKNYDKASLAYGEFAYTYAKTGNPELTAEALFQQGKVYEIQEYYSDAIKSWQALVSNYPKSKRAPEALFKISDLLFKAQQYEKALAGFQEILTRWSKDPIAEDAMLSIAEVYYNSDQEAKAVKAYEDFMKKYPDSKKVQSVEEGMQRAAFRKAEKKDDPVMLLEFADKYPKSALVVDALYKAGEIYYSTSKFQKAIEVFNRLIENFASDSLAINSNYYIGACFEGMQNFEGAISAYKTFIKNYPKHELASDVMFRLATAAYNTKNFSDAAFYYERIIEKYPGTEYAQNAMYNVALAYTELKKTDDAVSSYKRYMKEYPKDTKTKDIPAHIATIYLEQKRYSDAIKAYQEVADSGSDDMKLEAIYRMGDIYNTLEDYEHAIETFNKLIPLKPKDNIFRTTGLLNLATVYEEKQKWVDAVRIYELIIDSGGKKDYIDGAKARISEIKNAYPDFFKKTEAMKPKETKKETKKEEKEK